MPFTEKPSQGRAKAALHVRVDPDIRTLLDYYCQFSGRGKQQVVQTALLAALREDPDFQNWLHARDIALPLPAATADSHLRLVIDTLPSLVSYVDNDLRYRFMNRQYAQWFHRPPEYFHGKTMYEILPGEIYDTIRSEVARALKGETVVFEREVRFEADPPRCVRVTYVPDKVADGSVRGFVIVVEDITREREAERSLRNNEQRYRALVETSSQYVWMSDPSGGTTPEQLAWWTELTGQPAEASQGWGWLEMVHPEDRERVRQAWSNASQARTPLDVEYRIRTATGSYHRFAVHGIPIWNDDASMREWVGTSTDVTERRQAEDALRHSEERFRRIVETAAEGIWTVDGQANTTFVNDRMAQLLGCTASEMMGRSAFEFFFPEDVPAAQANFAESRMAPLPPQDMRLRRHDGSPLWTNIAANPLRDENGELIGVLAMFTDISERKASEEMQRAIERQLTLLIEASGALLASPESADVLNTILELNKCFVEADAYCVWRKERDANTWRIAAAEGLSHEYQSTLADYAGNADRLGNDPIVIEDIDKQPFQNAGRDEAYRQEGIKSLILVPLRMHGEMAGTIVFYYRAPHRFTHLQIRVASALGNLAAAALGTADLYERETKLRLRAQHEERKAHFLAEASQALASSLNYEATLAAVVDQAVPFFADWAGMSILEPSGDLRPVAVKHVDARRTELLRGYRDKFPMTDTDTERMILRTGQSMLVEEVTEEALAAGISNPEQVQFLLEMGMRSAIVAPLVAGGREIGVLSFVMSNSGRRYGKSDLALAEELARRAATAIENARLFREAEESHRALLRSNEELQRANEDLNQFAHSASHDLQEPLRMVAVYSQMLERRYFSVLDEDGKQFIKYAVDGAKRMEMLVRDLLAYTQAVNVQASAIEPVDTGEVVSEAVANLGAAVLDSGATIEIDFLPALAMRPAHLLQLFQNLIGNALKYRSEAAPYIRISSIHCGGEWQISVEDNGIGIAPQYAAQIFGIFKRLHTADKYSGTGIGLAICQKIVERYGGRIWVESEEGRGSRFCFTVPSAELS